MSVIPMAPRCQRCGATKKQPFGPVIEMEPAKGKQFASIGEPPSKQVMQDAVTKMQLELGNRKLTRAEELMRAGMRPMDAVQQAKSEAMLNGDWQKLSDD